jgi:hypothetical protein
MFFRSRCRSRPVSFDSPAKRRSRQPTGTATTVREKSGKVLTTDGPYVETKEQLGGYYI